LIDQGEKGFKVSKEKKIRISCDWKNTGSSVRSRTKTNSGNKSRLYKHKGDFSWQGIKVEKYKLTGKGWSDIVRHTLIGSHGETSRFHLRYFEIASGGYSSLEVHKHEHVIIGIRGRGVCTAGNKSYEIGVLDTVYIQPDALHQLKNPFNKPFGFFCIVNARRDRPRILD
jgi:ribulose-bisphosphate carboxylase large chain